MLKLKVFNYQTAENQQIALTPETRKNGQCTIGRALSCDLVVNSPEVSRVHGKITFDKGNYYYADLSSTYGSRINNEEVKVDQYYVLKEDDIIRIGEFFLVIEAVETPPSDADTTSCEELNGDHTRQWTSSDLTVRCVQVFDETADVKTFRLVADPPVLFNYKPGQLATLELEINGESVLSSYPISSTPSRPRILEITVKRVGLPIDDPNVLPDLVSNWLYDQITVGSSLKLIGGPMGNFTCVDKPSQKLLMISHGSGIIPMMSMSRWGYDTLTQWNIVFFHSARSARDIIFQQELEMMAARIPDFRLAITTAQSEPGQAWLGLTGKLTEAMLLSVAPDFRERTVYVCGPDTFMQEVKAIIEGLGFPMQNYYQDGDSNKSPESPQRVQPEPTIPMAPAPSTRFDLPKPLDELSPSEPVANELTIASSTNQATPTE